MCRKLGSILVVGNGLLQGFKFQYTASLLTNLVHVMLRRLCDICNLVTCVEIRFLDSIVQYSVAPELGNCSLPSSSVCHNMLRAELLLFVSVTVRLKMFVCRHVLG
jgi:hypothetical protein